MISTKGKEVILEAIESFSEAQIKKLQYESMYVLEKVRLEFEESGAEKKETFDEYMAR